MFIVMWLLHIESRSRTSFFFLLLYYKLKTCYLSFDVLFWNLHLICFLYHVDSFYIHFHYEHTSYNNDIELEIYHTAHLMFDFGLVLDFDFDL